jgi:hypothetical protein
MVHVYYSPLPVSRGISGATGFFSIAFSPLPVYEKSIPLIVDRTMKRLRR